MAQPERKPWDGPVAVQRVGDYIDVQATDNGEKTYLRMSEYNAWRVFAMLAMILGVSLPKALGKSIKMG